MRLSRCCGTGAAHQAVGSRPHLLGVDCYVPSQTPVVHHRRMLVPSGARVFDERLMEHLLRPVVGSVPLLRGPPSRKRRRMQALQTRCVAQPGMTYYSRQSAHTMHVCQVEPYRPAAGARST